MTIVRMAFSQYCDTAAELRQTAHRASGAVLSVGSVNRGWLREPQLRRDGRNTWRSKVRLESCVDYRWCTTGQRTGGEKRRGGGESVRRSRDPRLPVSIWVPLLHFGIPEKSEASIIRNDSWIVPHTVTYAKTAFDLPCCLNCRSTKCRCVLLASRRQRY